MRELFKGWRRKTGCVALVMACALAASWLRSLAASDSLWLRIGDRCQILRHDDGRISWDSYEVPDEYREVFPSFKWFSQEPDSNYELPLWYFESGLWLLHHSILTIPLTILSAYLILWKPRPKVERHA